MNNEDLYIRLYEDFTVSAEYLQADSEHRNFLAEGAIIAGLAFALGAFAKSFFEQLGKAAGEAAAARVKGALSRSTETADQNALLEGLELMAPFLAHLSTMTEGQRNVLRGSVAAELTKRGYPGDVAHRTGSELLDTLTAAGREQAR